MRSGVSQTPTLIVNGKYRVIGTSFEDMLRITDALVAQERAARVPAAAAAR
jgi:thiol:disulfide interchange protein DsbA